MRLLSAVTPSKSARRACTCWNSVLSHRVTLMPPVTCRSTESAEACSNNLRAVPYSCMTFLHCCAVRVTSVEVHHDLAVWQRLLFPRAPQPSIYKKFTIPKPQFCNPQEVCRSVGQRSVHVQ